MATVVTSMSGVRMEVMPTPTTPNRLGITTARKLKSMAASQLAYSPVKLTSSMPAIPAGFQ